MRFVGHRTVTPEELEFSISQYADGTLPEPQRPALEALLVKDSRARAMLEEHQSFTALLRSVPVPQVHLDQLARSISAALDEQDELEARVRRASWWLRPRAPATLALAASVLLALGLAAHLLVGREGDSTSPQRMPATAALIVTGPEADHPQGPSVAEVSIGPGGVYASDSPPAPYADQLDTRPSHLVIASGVTPDQPPPGFPF